MLPPNLTHLTFGNSIRHIKEGVLPTNLTHLTLNNDDMISISKKALPLSLTHLSIGAIDYKKTFPKNITHLTFTWMDDSYEFHAHAIAHLFNLQELVVPVNFFNYEYGENIEKFKKRFKEISRTDKFITYKMRDVD